MIDVPDFAEVILDVIVCHYSLPGHYQYQLSLSPRNLSLQLCCTTSTAFHLQTRALPKGQIAISGAYL